jgi:Replication-relaxation
MGRDSIVWLVAGPLTAVSGLVFIRFLARARRSYVRLVVVPYRTDRATPEAVVGMYEALHATAVQRWWRRLVHGQGSIALEVHTLPGAGRLSTVLAVACPAALRGRVEAAVRTAYPNATFECFPVRVVRAPAVLRLKKRRLFVTRIAVADPRRPADPPIDRVIGAMSATGHPCALQVALTPVPAAFELYSRWLYRDRERKASDARDRGERRPQRDRSEVVGAELRGGLDVQHRPLFFADVRVVAADRPTCEAVAAAVRTQGAENRLIERGTPVRQALFGLYDRRFARGEGNPLPSWQAGVYASTELPSLWQLPSIDLAAVPLTRGALPRVPAGPAIARPRAGEGLLRDAQGPVTIHPDLRRQNTAVPGAVEQGKTSYLVASVREDLRRERCAIIVLDPKGDAADAALSVVPDERACTILDFADPTCGFNPLAVDAAPDAIADAVVAAMRNLFDEGDIRASSDRYLRNAIIAALAYDRAATLWDAVRLLSVTPEGYAFRDRVSRHLQGLPEFKEVGEFFAQELAAQLRDARAMTTSKLDAPVNKAARILNSAAVKRVLQNTSLTIDFDAIIAAGEVLIVKGAMGAIGPGNTAVLMQLLVGMLDASLARQQDHVPAAERVAVALKIDEAPVVINRGFAQTMALKRSAGLETVACWQMDSQWEDRAVRDQLDALFAHRVYFATASTDDARRAASLMMAAYADQVRSDDGDLPVLARPDARLHLPKHHAICSWVTPEGRQPPFIAATVPLAVDSERIDQHHASQAARGGRRLESFHQAHWDRDAASAAPEQVAPAQAVTVALARDPALATRGGHVTDPIGDRERDDFAELREVLRAELAAKQAAPAPAARVEEADQVSTAREIGRGARGRASPVPAAERAVPGLAARLTEADRRSGDQRAAGAQRVSATSALPAEHPAPVAPPPRSARAPSAPTVVPESYTELVVVDEATRVTWPRRTESRPATPEPIDLEIIAWLADVRFALATQVHRRFFADRSYSTTQRRMRRMAQAGWVQRFQFFRESGASSALVYLVTDEGIAAAKDAVGPGGPYLNPRREWSAPSTDDQAMRRARHDLHVNAWVLAAQALLGDAVRSVRGPRGSHVAPPARTVGGERIAYGPADLKLPGGRTPHGFLRTDLHRRRVEVERFRAIEPDATLELRIQNGEIRWHTDLFVELDRTFKPSKNVDKFERYDHMLAGWALHKERYTKYLPDPPIVVFICRDQSNAKEFARAADPVVTGAHAYGGEYQAEWPCPARERMFFVAERDVHEGRLTGYALPGHPPDVRVAQADGDPKARACNPRVRPIFSAL